ncbi:hypothetical protein GCM10009850_111590 [Nonomuraea monospora]|uniref:Uncharacterized protein n=1 Tax=Nonomuraea monospora TaxID=568818 RepID=A0ABN3D1M2_9ACTN
MHPELHREFLLPLTDYLVGRDDDRSPRLVEQQLAKHHASLDGFAETHLIGQQVTRYRIAEYSASRTDLVIVDLDSRRENAAKAEGSTALLQHRM